jgi:putative effector of murein hydrolase
MTAYTRGKAGAYGPDSLPRVLSIFSSGTPLYALWTSIATNTPLPGNHSPWFGAGDAALSILECGILIWGFKLYECQRQLFSVAGLLTILVATAAAAGNVFLSVLAGKTLGLDGPEALAFAARSTTLALAKPAMTALGGNPGVNAALVVSNGILGQLCYPFVLDKLGVKREDDDTSSREGLPTSESKSSFRSLKSLLNTTQQQLASGDDPITIAAGITVGINGAAMGVSYLYETKSRAAPYAALAMTVSGVMTVVFTTVEPFKDVVLSLAS